MSGLDAAVGGAHALLVALLVALVLLELARLLPHLLLGPGDVLTGGVQCLLQLLVRVRQLALIDLGQLSLLLAPRVARLASVRARVRVRVRVRP